MPHALLIARSLLAGLAAAALSLGIATAQAAGRGPTKAVPPAPAADKADAPPPRSQPMGVWTSGEQDRACFRSRRKLWQDGEGWVVKRVNVCP